jgi:hypothetical protein
MQKKRKFTTGKKTNSSTRNTLRNHSNKYLAHFHFELMNVYIQFSIIMGLIGALF